MAKKNQVKTAVAEEELSGMTVGPQGINEQAAPLGSKDNPVSADHLRDVATAVLGETKSNDDDGPLMVITKAKVKSNEIYIEYNTSINNAGADIKLQSGCVPHPDLLAAMNQLSVHLAHLCDLTEFEDVEPGQEFRCSNIKISSFTISGEDEHEGIVISGSKSFGNKQINLNTPFTKFSNEHDPYKFSMALNSTVQLIIEELKLFINHGKCGETQLEMEFPEGDESGTDSQTDDQNNSSTDENTEEGNLPN